MPVAPIMIYGDDVSHVVTEEGVAYLYKARDDEERRAALAAVAGVSPIGLRHDPRRTEDLRRKGLIAFPEDLGIRPTDAKRSLLAARTIEDLVDLVGRAVPATGPVPELVAMWSTRPSRPSPVPVGIRARGAIGHAPEDLAGVPSQR